MKAPVALTFWIAAWSACADPTGLDHAPDATLQVGDGYAMDTTGAEAPDSDRTSAANEPIVVGRDDPERRFERLEDGASLVIVHGLQGGIHVELRLTVEVATQGDDVPSIGCEIALAREGVIIAYFGGRDLALDALEAPGTWITSVLPVVFESTDASLYAGQRVDLSARATLAGETTTLAPVVVDLVDPTLRAQPR